MVIVKFSGGLGNQIYQYTLLRRIQIEHPNVEVKADISDYILHDKHYGFEMEKIFGLKKSGKIKYATIWDYWKVKSEIPIIIKGKFGKKIEVLTAWINARTRKLREIRKNTVIIKEMDDSKYEFLESQLKEIRENKDYFVDGYWQDERYFHSVLNVVRNELQFQLSTDLLNMKWIEKIERTNSVSVHVRRGDYVNSRYDILDKDYYQRAIKIIKEKVDNPIFFIFSDDKEYVAETFKLLEKKYFVDNNNKENSWIDLVLMSRCKCNIVANSSFSNWGGYLNTNINKIVIYPDSYTTEQVNSEKFEKGWIKI